MKITRTEDRATGEIRYWLDKGGPQLLGPSYATRGEAETALAARLLGRKGGLVKSERKTAAVRANGRRGGRPRRVCVHCSEPVVMRRGATAHAGHRNAALDQTCGTWGWEWRKRTVD